MRSLGPYELDRVHLGRSPECLKAIPDGAVHACVTSPPYYGLRDYGTAKWEGGDPKCDHNYGRFTRGCLNSKQARNRGSAGDEACNECLKCGARRIDAQIGLEPTPEEYVEDLVEVFREVRRVLHPTGTLWLNLGDSYNAGRDGGWPGGHGALNTGRDLGTIYAGRSGANVPGLKPKDLVGIPWRVAFALQADGWWLRQDIIWAKPNPMPESITDRCTKAHEYVFLLAKSDRYFYDSIAISEPSMNQASGNLARKDARDRGCPNKGVDGNVPWEGSTRNRRSVWFIPTRPEEEAHFAVFPPDLVEPMILAGTSEKGCCVRCGAPWVRIVERQPMPRNDRRTHSTTEHRMGKTPCPEPTDGVSGPTTRTVGWRPSCDCPGLDGDHPGSDCADEDNWPRVPCVVLDPFAGSGTTLAVAIGLGRQAVGFDLNPRYVNEIAAVKVGAVRKGLTRAEMRVGQRTLFEGME